MTETTTTTAGTLNLDGPITRDQYITALQGIVRGANTVARQRGWCSEWLPTIYRIHEWIVSTGDGRMSQLNVPTDTPDGDIRLEWLTPAGREAYSARRDAGYAEELRNVRGRVLWCASGQQNASYRLTIAEANSVLAAAGLPQWADGTPLTRQYVVGLSAYVTESPLTREEFDREVRAAWEKFLEAYPVSSAFAASALYTDLYNNGRSGRAVPDDVTVPLLRDRRR